MTSFSGCFSQPTPFDQTHIELFMVLYRLELYSSIIAVSFAADNLEKSDSI